MKPNQIIITLILVVVVSIGAFFCGTKYQQKKTTSQFSQRMSADRSPNGQAPGRGVANGTNNSQGGGFNQTTGEITSIDDSSITVKTADGGSKIILISNLTSFNKSTQVAKTDLTIGTKIVVMGEKNTDGSITGKNIEINPQIDKMAPPVTTVTPTVKQ